MLIGERKKSRGYAPLVGVATVEVIAINPDQKTLQKILGKEVDAPIYVRSQAFPDGDKDVVDIVFWLKVKDAIARERVIRLQMSIVKSSWKSQKTGKIQVVNIFGGSTWVNEADYRANNYEAYPYFRPEGARLAYRGESYVVDTIAKWFGLPLPGKIKEDLSEAYCQIEDIPALFKGNFKELHSLVEAAKGATFKVLCGVRENTDGKVFQTVYNRLVLRSWETNYSKFETEISNISNAFYGSAPFELKEYKVETSDPQVETKVEEKKVEPNDPDDDLPF